MIIVPAQSCFCTETSASLQLPSLPQTPPPLLGADQDLGSDIWKKDFHVNF